MAIGESRGRAEGGCGMRWDKGGYLFLIGGSKGGDLVLTRYSLCTDVFTSALQAALSGKGDHPRSS